MGPVLPIHKHPEKPTGEVRKNLNIYGYSLYIQDTNFGHYLRGQHGLFPSIVWRGSLK